MLYTVAELSDLTGLSKVSIYNKLKLKEIEPYISKKQGVTYVSEEGLNLIKSGLKLNEDGLNSFKEDIKDNMQQEGPQSQEEIIDINKELVYALMDQLKEKDRQIENLHRLIENSQVLLKEKSQEDPVLLEDHFEELDNKIYSIREELEKRKQQEKEEGFFKRLFKK